MQDKQINLNRPVQSDNLYCLRPCSIFSGSTTVNNLVFWSFRGFHFFLMNWFYSWNYQGLKTILQFVTSETCQFSSRNYIFCFPSVKLQISPATHEMLLFYFLIYYHGLVFIQLKKYIYICFYLSLSTFKLLF